METLITTEIAESSNEIERLIHKVIQEQFKKKVGGIISKLEERISVIIYHALSSQPEWNSIISGALKGELGVLDGSTALFNILDTILQNIQIKVEYKSNPVISTVSIIGVNQNYHDLYSLPTSFFTSENGSIIEWLRWLLEGGDGVIVIGYDFVPGYLGRTKQGYMREGLGWSVPSQFAGSVGDNFITRAFLEAQPNLEKTINEAFNEL